MTRSILDYVLENLENTAQGGYFASGEACQLRCLETNIISLPFEKRTEIAINKERESIIYGTSSR